jgi:hypothetical protein
MSADKRVDLANLNYLLRKLLEHEIKKRKKEKIMKHHKLLLKKGNALVA